MSMYSLSNTHCIHILMRISARSLHAWLHAWLAVGAHHPSMVFLRVQKGADGSFFQLHACSLTPNGETDNNSLHGSCPTTKGEKWSATKWIHVGPFGGTSEAQRAKWCARSPS